jgi:hypothetical protein
MTASEASTRSRKRLTWRSLCETERRAYGVLIANFHGADAMDDTWKENMHLRQARDCLNAFDPISLTVNMPRLLPWHSHAHDCPRVDWSTFSNPPWRIDFVRPAQTKRPSAS